MKIRNPFFFFSNICFVNKTHVRFSPLITMEEVYPAINKEIDVDKFLQDYQERLNWIQENDKARDPNEPSFFEDESLIVSSSPLSRSPPPLHQ